MTTAEILEKLREECEDCLLADGFDEALIGTVEGACRSPVAAYDYDKCVEILMKRDGMTEEEAEEFMSFNVIGSFMGKMTPLFVRDWRGA